ncbi:MAG TPA: hypothetical protein VMW18_08280 [Candidatus Binatia bacterium]|nr:hypothetical protein [Candidatus Binatia bacterium]
MRDAAIYHRRAAECRELAEQSPTAAHRATWRELELLWLRLAAESERRAIPPDAADPHLPAAGGSAAASGGVGTVVFVYSEPDLRRKDTADAGTGTDRPTSNPDEPAVDDSDPGKLTAH